MPTGMPPAAYHDLLVSTILGHLATVDAHGRPQVNPVWFIWDEPHLLIGVKEDTVKYRNLRRDPRLAISFLDPANPGRYLELRGEVVEFARYDDLTFVNQLARKYTGADFTQGKPGEIRYKLTVRIDAFTAQG